MDDEKETCSRCGYELELVRPGKHQCNHCETIDFLERRLHKALELSGELIAMIRINVMRDSFRDVTIEQADEHLKPWIKRLNEIALKPDFGPTNAPILPPGGAVESE